MPTSKLTALAAATAALASLPAMPAVAAGPHFAPWAVGHLIGAAAQLATLPIIVAASVVSSIAQPPAPYYGAPSYDGAAPANYYNGVPPTYYPPPGYYSPPAYYQPAGYYASPPPYHFGSRYGATPAYYAPAGSFNRSPGPPHGYSVSGMRYSGPHGGQVFRQPGGFTHRR